MKIAIAGTGYVGLVTGVCLASKGHYVTCVDVDEEKLCIIQSGRSPIYESGLEELMRENRERLSYTVDYKSAYRNAEVIFIGVGTPEKSDGSANLTYVYTVARQIAQSIEHDCIVAIKSTVPIGTNEKIEKLIRDMAKPGLKIDVVSNPEFLSQGTAVHDTLHGSRIVIGADNPEAAEVMRRLYENFDIPIVITSRRSAEMIKYASNDFLALKISYINEIANLCEIIGANIEDVTYGMSLDPRIGDKFLRAGIGYGGSCFPKDTKALHWLANYHDYELKTIKAAIEVNENQKIKPIKKAFHYYESFEGLNAAVLGLSFKPGTDDLREAPSIPNIRILLEEGAYVKAWDPVSVKNFKKLFDGRIRYCDTIEQTIADTDICFIFTEWPQVVQFDITTYKKLMKRPIIVDGRNCYPLEKMRNMGLTYESIGRPVVLPEGQ